MYSYTIMPLDEDNIDAICEDIEYQYKNSIADLALFMMNLVPEGNPVINKAKIMGDKYVVFRDRLAEMGLECGILVQASIGHGYQLEQPIPFQQYTNLTNGIITNTCCPFDDDFCDYIKASMSYLAELNPKIIMVDDDFRLISRGGRGCACPLHIAEFNRLMGTEYKREDLLEILSKPDSENEAERIAFGKIQHESLVKAAKAMRAGIDMINPKLQGAFCACGIDPAGEIAKILAGEGNPSILRVNNGNYTPHGARFATRSFARAAMQISLNYNKADIYLAETDTCPQNRYSTPASSLHTHFTGSILEGTKGAKHWITRIIAHEPNSGKAYRNILSHYSGFYNELFDLADKVKWQGCRIAMPKDFKFSLKSESASFEWSSDCLERLGFPIYFSNKSGGAVFLNGYNLENFSKDEILDFFKGTLILASDSAEKLIDMGYGKYLGVEIKDWQGETLTGELLEINGKICATQNNSKEITVTDKAVKADSWVYNLKNGKEIYKLFPGSTVFKNSLGGTTVVFCGTPATPFVYSKAFSFLNESRKLQLIDILSNTGNLPIYYPGDAEVYLKAGYLPDGTLVAAFFNICLDRIEKISLSTDFNFSNASVLSHDGSRMDVEFEKTDNEYIFNVSAEILHPVILFLK